MWLLYARPPQPDAPYWPGRRWLAVADAPRVARSVADRFESFTSTHRYRGAGHHGGGGSVRCATAASGMVDQSPLSVHDLGMGSGRDCAAVGRHDSEVDACRVGDSSGKGDGNTFAAPRGAYCLR